MKKDIYSNKAKKITWILWKSIVVVRPSQVEGESPLSFTLKIWKKRTIRGIAPINKLEEKTMTLFVKNTTGIPTTCHGCGYNWKTQSKMMFATCPSCDIKTPIPIAKNQ